MYTLKLADGTQIKNLGMNGNNLVSKNQVDESLFEDNLSTVTITGEGETTVLHNAMFTGQREFEDGWYFSFTEIPPQEQVNISVKGKIEYLAMMTNVDLEEV